MEELVRALNQLKRDKYPDDDSLFILTNQFLPVKENSFKLFKRAELILWLVRPYKDGNKKIRVATVSNVDRYEDSTLKEWLNKELTCKFTTIILDWLSSGGLQKLMEDGVE